MEIRQIENITADANQRHIIELDGGNVTLVLKFHEQIQQWAMDVERNDKAVYGVKLATGVKHIANSNMGIDFAVIADADFDPFQIDDFEYGRCILLMVIYDI